MANKRTLMGVGMPGAQAFLLGTDLPQTFALAGTDQATATPLTGNFAVLEGGAGGAVLPPASGQGLQVIRAVTAGNLYPALGEVINALTANAPLAVAAGGRLLLMPGNGSWVAIVSA